MTAYQAGRCQCGERPWGTIGGELQCLNCGHTCDDSDPATRLITDGGMKIPDPEHPAFVDRDPRAIVQESNVDRTLPEVLDAVEQYEDLLQITRRISAMSIRQTRPLLNKLGLMKTPLGDLYDDPVLQQRVDILRQFVNDAEEVRK